MDDSTLALLLPALVNLKKLDLVLGSRGVPRVKNSDFNFEGVREILRAQECCLETLCLETDPPYELGVFDRYRGSEYIAPMTSFATFQKLKVLKINTIYIFGLGETEINTGWDNTTCRRLASFFPISLETLHLIHQHPLEPHFQPLLLGLKDLFFHRSGQFTALHKLVLEIALKDIKDQWDSLASCYVQGRMQGVSVVLTIMQYGLENHGVYPSVENEDDEIEEWMMDRGLDGLSRAAPNETMRIEILEEWREISEINRLNTAARKYRMGIRDV